MRWKETSLWLLFLIFCFGAGYLHGHLPDFRLQFVFSTPEKVKIVVFEKALFTPELVRLLEEKTHTEIEVETINNWQEARLKTVLNPGAHLLFLPSYWIPALAREGRLRTITSIKKLIDHEIAPELRRTNNDKIYDIPLFWTIFDFVIPEEFKNETFSKVLENPKIKNIYTYHDPELFKIRSSQEPWNYPKIYKKIIPTRTLDQKEINISPNEISEISIHFKNDLTRTTYKASGEKHPLQIYSLAIPNNSPQKITSIALIKALLKENDFDVIYMNLKIGSSLTRLDEKLTVRIQKASYLKELSFNEILLPDIAQ